jgi:hypothetical protein
MSVKTRRGEHHGAPLAGDDVIGDKHGQSGSLGIWCLPEDLSGGGIEGRP